MYYEVHDVGGHEIFYIYIIIKFHNNCILLASNTISGGTTGAAYGTGHYFPFGATAGLFNG
jgi:hypothetical protein